MPLMEQFRDPDVSRREKRTAAFPMLQQPPQANLFVENGERYLLTRSFVHSSGILVLRSGGFDAILPAAAQ